MNNSRRIEKLRERLQAALKPQRIDIEDQSHLHAGHAGAKEGKAHLKLVIVAEQFADLTPIKCHRLVYAAAGDLMDTDIHALTIDARAPKRS